LATPFEILRHQKAGHLLQKILLLPQPLPLQDQNPQHKNLDHRDAINQHQFEDLPDDLGVVDAVEQATPEVSNEKVLGVALLHLDLVVELRFLLFEETAYFVELAVEAG
jgi:hypothetical protein